MFRMQPHKVLGTVVLVVAGAGAWVVADEDNNNTPEAAVIGASPKTTLETLKLKQLDQDELADLVIQGALEAPAAGEVEIERINSARDPSVKQTQLEFLDTLNDLQQPNIETTLIKRPEGTVPGVQFIREYRIQSVTP